jgi:hypothetical protein
LLGTAALCALLAACGGGDGDDAGLPEFKPPTAVTESPGRLPTPTPTESFAQDNPVDAYRGFMQAVQIAIGTANAEYPDLAQYAQGGALEHWQGRARELEKTNHVILGPLVIRPKLDKMISSNKALVDDCFDDREWVEYDRATGGVVPGKTPKPPIYLKGGMVKVGSVWKVEDTFGFGRGAGPCGGS